jgi:hypothetical protein
MLIREALTRRGAHEEESLVSDGLIGASAPHSYAVYSCNCSDSAIGSIYMFSRIPYEPIHSFREDDHAFLTMLASEAVLSRDWNSPEEDEAWADL